MTKETKWSIDQTHSEIGFKVRHLMISNVKGSFGSFDASIYTTGTDFSTANIDLWIDASSVTTGNAQRDEHMKSAEFFDVAKYPEISFTSSTIAKPDANGNHALWGELTMKGETRNLELDVQFGGITTDPWGNHKAGFSLSGKILRSEWGLTWNTVLETGGMMVSDEVFISCEIELLKTSANKLTMELDPKSSDGVLNEA